jgi:hypothetical protein
VWVLGCSVLDASSFLPRPPRPPSATRSLLPPARPPARPPALLLPHWLSSTPPFSMASIEGGSAASGGGGWVLGEGKGLDGSRTSNKQGQATGACWHATKTVLP